MSKKIILYIDDEVYKLADEIESESEKYGYEVLYCSSIEEGLSTLNQYSVLVDGLLIDMRIGNENNKIFELLTIVKNQYPHLAIILIIDDKYDDFEMFMTGIKLGASDYILRKPFSSSALFKKFESLLKKRNTNINTFQLQKSASEMDVRPGIYVIPPSDTKTFFRAVFGYRLLYVTTPSEEDEKDNFSRKCFEWHKQLLSVINYAGKDNMLNLKFIDYSLSGDDKPYKMEILLFVTIKGDSEQGVKEKANTLIDELAVYLDSNPALTKIYYIFQAIYSEKLVKVFFDVSNLNYSASFQRKSKKEHYQLKSLGFKPELVTSEKNTFPLFVSNNSKYDINTLFSILLETDKKSVIDVVLRPHTLSKGEMDFALRISEKNKNSNSLIKESISQFYEKFLNPGIECFNVSLFLSQDEKEFSKSLLSSVSGFYFGESGNCDISFHEGIDVNTYGSNEQNNFQKLYTIDDAFFLFRFPFSKYEAITGINILPSSWLSVPLNIPIEGILLGEKEIGSKNTEIRIKKSDLFQHTYVMGQTGTGKTTLISTMIKDLIDKGEGVCLVDPHGDVAEQIMEIIPEERKGDLVYFNPVLNPQPIHMNILEYDVDFPEQKTFIFNSLYSIIDQKYNLIETGGPMFELYLKNAMFLLMNVSKGRGTLVELVEIFYDSNFRQKLVDICKDDKIVSFWKQAEMQTDQISMPNISAYITSKLNRFSQDDFITPIIKYPSSNINFREIIDKKKIFIVKLPKGRLGVEGVKFLGTIIFSRIIMAAFSRENIKFNNRTPYYLFVDEFQNFTSSDLGLSLSECRKYGLSIVLANQTLEQLDSKMVGSILGNVGNMMIFRPGLNDYIKVEPYIQGSFERKDILNLPNYQCVAKIRIDNMPVKPFLFKTVLSNNQAG